MQNGKGTNNEILNLVYDEIHNAIRVTGSTSGGSGGVIDAKNGLHLDGQIVKLGGNLTEDTVIDLYNKYLNIRGFQGGGINTERSSFIVNGNSVMMNASLTTFGSNMTRGYFSALVNGAEFGLYKVQDESVNNSIINISTDGMVIEDGNYNKGLEYLVDYEPQFTDLSLIHKKYVDDRIIWYVDGSQTIRPVDTTVHNLELNVSGNHYTQVKLRNDDDTGVGAGAIIELKGSGADYSNNMYIGKYGANFWIPELTDSGAVMTDKNLVIGTVGSNNKVSFINGDSYINLHTVAELSSIDFRYLVDDSANWVDLSLVHKKYVDRLEFLKLITITIDLVISTLNYNNYQMIRIDASSNNVGVTLPQITNEISGKVYTFKTIDGTSNNAYLICDAADTFDETGGSLFTFTSDNQIFKVVADISTNEWVSI